MFVASKKKMKNCIFDGHLVRMFKDPFFSAFGESDAFILANAYPENIKAIGSTGRTNL